jgi:hypothetical protein
MMMDLVMLLHAGHSLGFPRMNEPSPAAPAFYSTAGCFLVDLFLSSSLHSALSPCAWILAALHVFTLDPLIG